jgi:hypothetical protein
MTQNETVRICCRLHDIGYYNATYRMSARLDVALSQDTVELVLCPVLKQLFIYRIELHGSQQITRGWVRRDENFVALRQTKLSASNTGRVWGWRRRRRKTSNPIGRGEQNANESIYLARGIAGSC